MSNIAKAYNNTKAEADPDYANVALSFRNDLETRAAHVDSSGLANTPFEIEYKKLSAETAKNETVETLATLPKAEVKTENDTTEDKPLNKLSRAELDVIGEQEFGFNPSDYSNKDEIVAAIEEARAKK